VLGVALLLSVFSVVLAATRLQYHTSRSDLMDPNKECEKRWRAYLSEFGDDDDMVVVVRGGDRRQMIAALDAVAERIAARPDLFDRLFYRVDLRPLRPRALLLLPVDQVQKIHDDLEPMNPLLFTGTFGWEIFSYRRLVTEAHIRAGKLEPGEPLNASDEQFFRQFLAISRSAGATLANPGDYRNPWASLMPAANQQQGPQDYLDEPQYFFNGDNTLAFLMCRPVREQGSFTAARASVDGLRSILNEVRPQFGGVLFGLTGLPVLENDEMVASQHDTELASWLALSAVGALYLIVFRGVRYPLLTIGTLVVGITWAMGWLTLTVGHLNILSTTFAVMLIAMGDYGVLWVTRYEQARRSGLDARAALIHTATHVAVGNLTAATALALAFFAAMFADFPAVAELGWIAGCGVLLCAVACFTVLPSALMMIDRRGSLLSRPWSMVGVDGSNMPIAPIPWSLAMDRAAPWLPRLSSRPFVVIGTALTLTLVLGVFACRVHYDHNLLNLQDQSLEAVRWEKLLIEQTNGASWHSLSFTNTPEEALALKARFEALPEVGRVVEVASLVPRDQDRKIAILRDIQKRLAGLPVRSKRIPHTTTNIPNLVKALEELSRRLRPLSSESKPTLLAEVRDAVEAVQTLLTSRDPEIAAPALQEFDTRMTGDLAENLHQLNDVSTPTPITLEDLPPALRERHVGKSGKWLLRVFARDCNWDYEPLERFTRAVQSVDPEATGKPFGTIEGLRSLRDGFLWAGLYALIVIVLVLLVDFRSVSKALIALAPLAMGLVLSIGVMGLLGRPLNPANVIALPLILGVGIDNGVHVLHDYLLRRRTGETTISRAIGRGVLVKALTTMIGFGSLMISTHRGLSGLGFILMLGVGCCMLTALVFLPAVLRLIGANNPSDQAVQQRQAA
jgi:hopanoid biosynthesis associated RND transporter like protein HpnN